MVNLEFLTVGEFARSCLRSERTVYRAIKDGRVIAEDGRINPNREKNVVFRALSLHNEAAWLIRRLLEQ